MKKNNPQIKTALTLQDRIDAIETIASLYFRNITDENGNTSTVYTPYLEEVGQITAIAKYFIEGLEFEENEDIYDAVINDTDVFALVSQFFISADEEAKEPSILQRIFIEVMNRVVDIVNYRKSENLARIQNEANSVLTYKLLEMIGKEQEKVEKEIEATNNLNKWLDEQREQQEKLNAIVTPEMQKDFIEKFDVNTMTEAIYKQLSESELHKKNQEIVEANRKIREQDNKIIELKNEFAREKQKENVKNVLAEDGKAKVARKRTSKAAKASNIE